MTDKPHRPAPDFHPDLRRMARLLPRSSVGQRSLRAVRAGTNLLSHRPDKRVQVEHVGSIRVRIHRPLTGGERRPALLWIHGGGYVLGTAVQDDPLCRLVAARLGVTVAAPEYRLAPDHRFPVPLEDCFKTLTWLAEQPYVDHTRVAVGGASAGGGLAAALVLRARGTGFEPSFQLLSYPMLDDRTATRTGVDESMFRLWNNSANRFGWQAYIGRPPGSSDVSELAAPGRCQDFTGLAPAWIGVGTLDLFYDECLEYARRLQAAGVPCALDVVDGAYHGFDTVQPRTGVAKTYRAAQLAALDAALNR